MAKPSERESGEKLQIAVLTFAMTAGGFALVTLVFALFFNPSARGQADDLTHRYKELVSLLSSPEMRGLRTQDNLVGKKDNTKSLRDIVGDNLGTFAIDFKSFPVAKPGALGKAGLEEIHQQIDLKPKGLTPILQFIASVKEA